MLGKALAKSTRFSRRKSMRFSDVKLAAWLVERLAGSTSDPIMGDLEQQYGGGRSRVWFWRQVFGAIIIGTARRIVALWRRSHRWLPWISVACLLAAAIIGFGPARSFFVNPSVQAPIRKVDSFPMQGWMMGVNSKGVLVLKRYNQDP